MKELPRSLFDIYALALPRGHGFGEQPPISAWQSEDGRAYGVVTRHINRCDFGFLSMRRRVDHVWTKTAECDGFPTENEARRQLKVWLENDVSAVPMPRNTAQRPALYDLGKRRPSDVFSLLTNRSHHIAAWLLNQLYLSLPAPDKNWAGDCQTRNFHTRLWEAQLLASFREQGLLVTQPYPSPDFRIENRRGGVGWVEAVTANPEVPYEHVNAPRSSQPESQEELFFGPAAVRYAKTLGSKLQKKYHEMDHVADDPFMIAIADFHAPASMVWSREALIGYLYGSGAHARDINGKQMAVPLTPTHLRGTSAFPAGLFTNADCAELSAVLFSNACSVAKLNRVGASAGADTQGLRYTRIGNFFDRTPGALKGIPFCLDVTSDEYRSLWPLGYEPWNAELEIFHNPHASIPLPKELLPEATHWFERDGEMICESHYETSILWSQTMIQKLEDRMPTLNDFVPRDAPEE